jgi:hypothetical protein
MLAFAYRGGDAEEGGGDIRKSFEEVERQASVILGAQLQSFVSASTESRQDVPRQKTISFVPCVAGLEFNPPERAFRWVEKVHQETFRFRAPSELDPKQA